MLGDQSLIPRCPSGPDRRAASPRPAGRSGRSAAAGRPPAAGHRRHRNCVLGQVSSQSAMPLFGVLGCVGVEAGWVVSVLVSWGRGPSGSVATKQTLTEGPRRPGCGEVASGRGRRTRRLHDLPAFGVPVEPVWRQRRYRCAESLCPVGGFSEVAPAGWAAGETDEPGSVVGEQPYPTRQHLSR